jgi:two-component system, cell cycle sensor histidine kinase and response regulator CckA
VPFRQEVHALRVLRESTELLRRFFDQSAVGFLQIEPTSGRLIRVNRKMCEISGRSRDELLARVWPELVPPEDVAAGLGNVARALRGDGESVSVETRFVRGDGALCWVRATFTRVDLPDGSFALIAAAEDITERRRTEDALRDAERRLATVFQLAPVPIVILRWRDRRIVEVNDAFTTVFGWTRDEALGSTTADLRIRTDDATANAISERLSSEGSLTAEAVMRTRAGQELTCVLSCAFADIDGERCTVTFIRDVTRRRALDEALRRSEAELRAMFDVVPIGIAQTDPATGRWVRVNQRMCEITGYEAEELCGMSPRDITHPDDVARHVELYGAVAQGELPGYRLEKRYVCKGGRVAWVSVNMTVLEDPTSHRKRLIAAVEDITERRDAEQRLSLHVSAFQAADNGIVITDANGVVVHANRSVSRHTGYDESEIVGRTPDLLNSGEHSTEYFRTLWDTIRSGRVWRGEIVNRRKDGSLYHEDQTITPVRGARGEITHFIAIKNDITDRKRAEAALAEAEEQQRLALDAADLGTWRHDIVGRRMHFDERAMAQLGLDAPEMAADAFIDRVHPDDGPRVREAMAKSHDPAGGGRHASDYRVILPSGQVRWFALMVLVRFAGEGDARRAVSSTVTMRDITESKRAEQRQRDIEDQLRAAQKMEAVGRLAGGVAHDFNNLLSVILSYSEVASGGLSDDDPLRADFAEIVRAAKRAEGLTAQLLAFSRHQVGRPQSMDMNAIVHGVGKMLRRLIGEDIALDIAAADDLFPTRADPGQIEQVLMNLAVNARDAMPDGGRLVIGVANVEVDAQRAPALQVEPGKYVELTVSDTGCGMDPVTRARVFDPFFTTKGIGKGTGLGLSTVYGIVRQSGGGVIVESALGAGATFRIYLKRDEGDPSCSCPGTPTTPSSASTCSGTRS